jgi:hypothetical protein
MPAKANAKSAKGVSQMMASPRAPTGPGTPPHPAYPVLEQTPALICTIVNIALLPGIGTLIAGAMGGKSFYLRGILQLLLTPVIIGYVWSLMSAIRIMGNANWARRQMKAGRPVAVA